MRVVEGWKEQATKIGFAKGFEGAIDLTEAQYDGLHCGRRIDLPQPTRNQFVIDRIGERSGEFDETGIEYYRYLRD